MVDYAYRLREQRIGELTFGTLLSTNYTFKRPGGTDVFKRPNGTDGYLRA